MGLCDGKSTVTTYDATKCVVMCAAVGVAALVGVPFPFCFAAAAAAAETVRNTVAECYQGQTEYETCFADFTDWGTCMAKYHVKCSVHVYQRN